jgi:hypothetical protein
MKYLAQVMDTAGNPAADVLIILFFFVAGFLWGTLGGKSKLLSFMLSTYVGLFMSPLLFRILDEYKIAAGQYRNLVIYFVVLIVLFLLFDKGLFGGMGRSSYRWWQAFAMSFLSVGLFVAGTLNLIKLRGILEISPITRALFAGSTAYLLWAILPVVGLFIVSRSR